MGTDGGFGAVEALGDFFGGEVFHVAEDEGGAFARGEFFQPLGQPLAAFSAEGSCFRRFKMPFRGLVDLAEHDALVAAEKIEGCVGGDSGEPVGGFIAVLELVLMLKGFDERFLGEVLSVFHVTDEAVDLAENAAHVLVDELVLYV